MSDFEMVKQLYDWGFDIEFYLKLGTITPDEYKQITGNDYAAGKN